MLGFTDLLLIALAAILVVAAVIDVRTFTISNRLNATVALGAPLYWLSIAMAWPGIAVQLAAGGIVFGASKKEGRPKIPYGVAIALGGLAILAQRFLNQFA